MALILSVLGRPLFWLLFGLLAVVLLWLAWRQRLHWRPAWVLRVLILALVLVGIFLPRADLSRGELPQRQALVIDQSDSVSLHDRQSIWQQAQAWQAEAENRVVVAFGASPQAMVASSAAGPEVDGRASDLEGALHLAGDLLGAAPGKVILASDGQVSVPSGVAAAITGLKEQGHALDVIPLAGRSDPHDGFVGPLWAPANLWENTPFDVILPVYPPQAGGKVDLQLAINGQPSGLAAEPLDQNFYRFRLPPQPQGITTLEVAAAFNSAGPDGDPFPENNAAFATLQVFAAPNVLFVSLQPLSPQAAAFVGLLGQAGLQVEVRGPEALPTNLSTLENYRVIFLHDLLSTHLNQEQMLALQIFVSRQAGGLVVLGGRSSFTLGGYQGTPLEAMLPVDLEPPPRSQRPPIAFLLIMDRSASMSASRGGSGARPIELAREAAMRAIETMRPEDYLGVLPFNDEFNWDVPIRPLGDGLALREALDAVSRVQAAGGTKMYQAMQAGLGQMFALPAGAPASRHVLILSDGQSFDGSAPEFQALAEQARQRNITISTIAFGEGADHEVMAQIAENGKGRYYAASHPDELPRILIHESQAARSENVQAGQTALKLGEANHPILSGLNPAGLPQVSAYNALSSKREAGAEDILLSANFGDPILSAWQYGLGRVIAWTSDIGEEWSGAWASPDHAALFWSQVARYALVNPALAPVQVDIQVTDTRLQVAAAILGPRGEPVNLAQAQFSYAGPDGRVLTYSLPQISAGVYQLDLPRPAEGAYRGLVAYTDEEGQRIETAAPFAVNPPPEWLYAGAAQAPENLAAWASQAGGEILPLELAQPAEPEAEPRRTADTRAAWWRLLLALLILWPLEVALRRRWLPWW